MLGFKLLISYRFLWLLLGAISAFFFLSDDIFDSLRYAQIWFDAELGTQIGLDKYNIDFDYREFRALTRNCSYIEKIFGHYKFRSLQKLSETICMHRINYIISKYKV